MTEHDPTLVEKAQREGWRAYKEGGGVDDVVNAVLDAVAEPLRAEGAAEAEEKWRTAVDSRRRAVGTLLATEAELEQVKAERDEMRHWRDFYRAEAERMNDDAQCYAGHECGHCGGCTGDVDA